MTQNVSAPRSVASSPSHHTAMRAPTVVAAALAAGALIAGLGACGAGQVSQTATQYAAVNGAGGQEGPIAIRNAHIVFPKANADEVFEKGGPFQLAFLASNRSPSAQDSLTSIKLAGSTVTISGDTAIRPTGALIAGPADLSASGVQAPASSSVPSPKDKRLTVTIADAKKTVHPGLSVPVEFVFARQGSVKIDVPVDAGTSQERRADSFLNRDQAGAHQDPEAGE